MFSSVAEVIFVWIIWSSDQP